MSGPKICRYFDIPFQHADRALVKAMKRGLDGDRALRLLDRIRTKLPGAAVRTSLIVGFPGEGPKEFAVLRRFVETARFDHLGVFAYSPEKGTASFALSDPVPAAVKEDRRREIMEIQARISGEKNAALIGRTVETLVEGPDPAVPGLWTGRGRFQAPEVDGIIRFSLPPGMTEPASALVPVEITAAGDYDLSGRLR